MNWKKILKNEPPMLPTPPMPPPAKPPTKYPERDLDDMITIVKQRIVPAMKAKGTSPYRFTRDGDPEIFYLLVNAKDEMENIVAAFNNLGHGIPKITFEPNTVVIKLRAKL